MSKLISKSQCRKALLYLKGIAFVTTSSSSSPTSQYRSILLHHPSSAFALNYTTNAIASSGKHSYTVSYLVNNFGFSPQTALNASKQVRFETSEKPDSVVSFFRNHAFSESQIKDIIRRAPWLLSYHPNKTILPKFEFFHSKGASTSDIVSMTTKSPFFLRRSLENHLIPTFEFLKGFFLSDEATMDCIKAYAPIMYVNNLAPSVKLLLENGVTELIIARILGQRASAIIQTPPNDLVKAVEEVKALGFNPLQSTFFLALKAKLCLSQSQWEAKVDVYKKWGWSEEACLEAFRKQPQCMLASKDKIDAVMSFWVNQLGWDPLVLVEGPMIFGFSLKKRIIPRALVLQFLLSKSLRNKNDSLLCPFIIPEKMFLKRFVECFEGHDYQLLKLYEENMNM